MSCALRGKLGDAARHMEVDKDPAEHIYTDNQLVARFRDFLK